MLLKPICLLFGHKVQRRKVEFDGKHYRGRCRRCRAPLIRYAKGWKRHRDHSVNA